MRPAEVRPEIVEGQTARRPRSARSAETDEKQMRSYTVPIARSLSPRLGVRL